MNNERRMSVLKVLDVLYEMKQTPQENFAHTIEKLMMILSDVLEEERRIYTNMVNNPRFQFRVNSMLDAIENITEAKKWMSLIAETLNANPSASYEDIKPSLQRTIRNLQNSIN